jgi:hypothetical protein
VQDFDVLKGPAKSSNVFSVGTDACNHKNKFLLVVSFFYHLSGVKNRLVDFIEQQMKQLMLSII